MRRLDEILRELAAREPIFHRAELGTTREDFDRMMAEEFWEISASGRIFTRDFVLDLLEERHKTTQVEDLRASEFRITELAPDIYMLHYTLVQGERKTRRTTVWRQVEKEWKSSSTKER